MRKLIVPLSVFVTLAFVAGAHAFIDEFDPPVKRGDANNNGTVEISDSSYISNYLFFGGPAPSCMDAADANDDGVVDGADASYIADYLFNGGPQPPSPGPYTCGQDPTSDTLGCNDSACP